MNTYDYRGVQEAEFEEISSFLGQGAEATPGGASSLNPNGATQPSSGSGGGETVYAPQFTRPSQPSPGLAPFLQPSYSDLYPDTGFTSGQVTLIAVGAAAIGALAVWYFKK